MENLNDLSSSTVSFSKACPASGDWTSVVSFRITLHQWWRWWRWWTWISIFQNLTVKHFPSRPSLPLSPSFPPSSSSFSFRINTPRVYPERTKRCGGSGLVYETGIRQEYDWLCLLEAAFNHFRWYFFCVWTWFKTSSNQGFLVRHNIIVTNRFSNRDSMMTGSQFNVRLSNSCTMM